MSCPDLFIFLIFDFHLNVGLVSKSVSFLFVFQVIIKLAACGWDRSPVRIAGTKGEPSDP